MVPNVRLIIDSGNGVSPIAYEIKSTKCQPFCPGSNVLYSSPPGQNGRHCADDIFNCILLNENDRIPIQISLKYVPRSPIENEPALV